MIENLNYYKQKSSQNYYLSFVSFLFLLVLIIYLPKLLAKAAFIKRTNKGCGFNTVLLYSG